MHSAALAAVLVVFCSGAIAAPIAAYLRIDTLEITLTSSSNGAEIFNLDPVLSLLAPEIHTEPALDFPGATLGEIPEQAVPGREVQAQLPLLELPEPPSVIMSGTGLGLGAVLLWRRRTQVRKKRRFRKLQLKMREMAPIL